MATQARKRRSSSPSAKVKVEGDREGWVLFVCEHTANCKLGFAQYHV